MNDVKFKKPSMFIYELPYAERTQFCNIMDMNGKWRELGGKFMKFDCATLFRISQAPMRNFSSTDELLSLWGEQNHTVLDLFTILYEMQHYQAMTILKPFVDDKYHKLIFQKCNTYSHLLDCKNGSNLNNENDNLINFITDSSTIKDSKHDNVKISSKTNETSHFNMSSSTAIVEACTPFITNEELKEATENWSETNILGRGGFGVVFKGMWKNTKVAIKREKQRGSEQQSFRELKYLTSCRHDNILSIYGFSIDRENTCLVYQFMSNGSLEDRLQCRQGTLPLPWNTRFKIATGSARGLQFVHGMPKPIIHGDIKSANILLDEHFEPRIGDFGLARDGPIQQCTHVQVSHVTGTAPYLPYEFVKNKKLSTKVDTYSFGMVLFEISTGLRAYDRLKKIHLKDYVENHEGLITDIADMKAGSVESNKFTSLINIGKKCVKDTAKLRPEMEEVLRLLENELLGNTNKDQLIIRNNDQYELRKSTPAGSNLPQQWPFSHVQNQIECVPTIIPSIEEINGLKMSSKQIPVLTGTTFNNYESSSSSMFSSKTNIGSESTIIPHIIKSESETGVKMGDLVVKNVQETSNCEESYIPDISALKVSNEC